MEISVQTFEKICRICLLECADMKSLFTKMDGEDRNLFEILAFTANINVKIEDGLPKQVCGECESVMCKADAFKRRCLNSETILKNIYQNSVSKAETSNRADEYSIKDEKGDINQELINYDRFSSSNVTNCSSQDNLDGKRILVHVSSIYPMAESKFSKVDDSKLPKNYEQSVKVEVINHYEEDIDFSEQYDIETQCEIMPIEYKEESSVKSDRYKYTCNCKLQFINKEEYKSHLKQENCDKFKIIVDKIKDSGCITIKKQIKCVECTCKFNTLNEWRIHQQTHQEKDVEHSIPVYFECKFCLTKFKSKASLVLHIQKHENTVRNKTESYQCSMCLRKFKNKITLTAHIQNHEKRDNIKHVCGVCKREFKYKAYLENHILNLHSKKNGIKCDVCAQHFPNAKSLETHKESHQIEKKHQCSVCNKSFLMLCTLKEHMRTHTGEKPFLCSQCGRRFSQKTNLAQHMRRHQGLKPFKCENCEKRFVSKGELDAHNRKHSGAHPFICDDCGNGFTTSSALVKHRRIHTGEKPYQCDLCPMKFAASGTLTNHRRTHTGEKPFQCSYCEKAFTQRNDLISHIRCHTGEKPYICNLCGQSFRKAAGLKNHVKMHVKEPVSLLQGVNVMTNGMQCAEQ